MYERGGIFVFLLSKCPNAELIIRFEYEILANAINLSALTFSIHDTDDFLCIFIRLKFHFLVG